MRPLKLELSGFGTYCKKTVIDLEKLGKNGLYLICGDTGSGKTTIFDAISYALFDHSSGANKEQSMLRSSFATAETKTYVELTFEHIGKVYVLHRNPAYERASKRGKGTTKEQSNASIICAGMESIAGSSAVNAFIQQLLGLDQKQFSQIAMIAQGDFQKILFADTTTRLEIFRKLFKTENYKKLQDRLKEESSLLNTQCSTFRTEFKTRVNSIKCDDENVLSIKAKKAKKDELPASEIVELLEILIKEDLKKLEQELKKDAQINKELETINGEYKSLLEKQNLLKELTLKKENLNIQTKTVNQAEIELEKQTKNQEETKKMSDEFAVLNSKMEQYDLLKQKEGEFKETSVNLRKVSDDKSEFEEKKISLTEILCSLKNESEELKDCDVDLVRKENLLKEKKDEEYNLQELDELFNQYADSQEKLLAFQKKYKELKGELEEKQRNYHQLKSAFMDSQAGILASSLEENKPCPVCGSLHHPAPAKLLSEGISKENVEQAENLVLELDKKVQNASIESSGGVQKVKNLFSQIVKKYSLYIEKKELLEANLKEAQKQTNEKLVFIKKEYEALSKEAALLKQKQNRRNEVEHLLKKKQTELEECINKLSTAKEEEAKLTQKELSVKAAISEIKKSLEYESFELAEQRLGTLKKNIQESENALKAAQEKKEKAQTQIDSLKGKIEVLVKQTKDFSLEQQQAVEVKKNEMDIKKSYQQNILSNINLKLETNKGILKDVSVKLKELAETEKKYSMVNSLYKTASGTLGNKTYKIQLETYVQMTFLDKVIALANKRLGIMSDGQYDLIRQTENGNKFSAFGLDINVIDHYNGGERSVRSLSGGESFEASLALALGLSDVIANYAGGIKIDTMFIDEGFGTLDSETLQKAFKALTSISEGNDKLIGIISHVDLLKDKISKQIRVTKTVSEGSNVQIIS